MNQIPKSFKKYFWDVNIKNIDQKKNKDYIIERLLEFGDIKAYHWLKLNFPKNSISEIASKSRRLSPKTKNFWQTIY